jgi:hypothetical protein
MTKTSMIFNEKAKSSQTADASWKSLYRVGTIAALIAALVFRRNLGVAEIPLLTGIAPHSSVAGWFTLLRNNPLLGLTLLNVFDITNYALVGIMFLAVFVALRLVNKSCTLLAFTFSLLGIGIYIVSNSALLMLSLSNQYATATTDAQRSTLLAAGQAVLANGYNSGAVYQGAGFYLSLLLVAMAGMLMSAVMLKSIIFSKITAYIGIVASAFDLAYLVGLTFVPQAEVYLLGVICIASAGLFLMIWHLLIGIKLYHLGSTPKVKGVSTQGQSIDCLRD